MIRRQCFRTGSPSKGSLGVSRTWVGYIAREPLKMGKQAREVYERGTRGERGAADSRHCSWWWWCYCFPSHLLSLPLFSLSLLVVTQIRGHILVGSSPPLPLRLVAFIFIARRLQPFLPLRFASNSVLLWAVLIEQLFSRFSLSFFKKNRKSRKNSKH